MKIRMSRNESLKKQNKGPMKSRCEGCEKKKILTRIKIKNLEYNLCDSCIKFLEK